MIAALDTPQSAKVDTESLLAKISASRLTCFLQCRLKFMFRYVLQIKKPATGALHVGKSVHWALQQWSKARWFGRPLDNDSLKQGFDLHWTSSQEKEPVAWEIDEEEKQKDKAWGLVDMYLRDTPIPPDEKPEGVEVSIEADLPDGLPKLVGVIDLVRPEGVVVDFKTSSTTPLIAQAIHRNEAQDCTSILVEMEGRRFLEEFAKIGHGTRCGFEVAKNPYTWQLVWADDYCPGQKLGNECLGFLQNLGMGHDQSGFSLAQLTAVESRLAKVQSMGANLSGVGGGHGNLQFPQDKGANVADWLWRERRMDPVVLFDGAQQARAPERQTADETQSCAQLGLEQGGSPEPHTMFDQFLGRAGHGGSQRGLRGQTGANERSRYYLEVVHEADSFPLVVMPNTAQVWAAICQTWSLEFAKVGPVRRPIDGCLRPKGDALKVLIISKKWGTRD